MFKQGMMKSDNLRFIKDEAEIIFRMIFYGR